MTPSKRGHAATGSLLLLLLSSSHPTPTLSSNPNFSNSRHSACPNGLKCHHGGQCAVGDKDPSLYHSVITTDLPWIEALNVNGEHCTNCHDGWGGVDCKRRYQVCDDANPDAPTCFNGGTCFKKGISAESGKYEYMCDCTEAKDGHENEGNDGGMAVQYAGKYCQHVKEEYCDEEMFCTNGGKCSSVKYASGEHAHFTCECPAHRAGTHCEFLEEEGFSYHKKEPSNQPEEEVFECTLQCEHGVCAKGFKSYDNLIGTGPFPAQLARDIISDSGEHCVCPDGYTGLRCEIPAKRCGPNKMCYNGSTCAYDDAGNPMCDCNSAHTDEVSFAGLSCEQESTSHCTPGLDQDQKDSFCTNHGRCIEDPETRHEGCDCDDGWSGDLCDFKMMQSEDIMVVEEPPVCDLECNGGSCRFGIKGYKDSYDALSLPAHAKKQEDGMYCSCPAGFTGLKCEVDMNHCDDTQQSSEHFCLNGVPCAPDALEETFDGATGLKQFACQCDSHANDAVSQMLAGRFCEYAVTEFCSEEEERHNHSFCTNGGKCKKYNSRRDHEHHGCCCPAGYEGEYCQFPEGTLDLETTPVTWSSYGECKHKKNAKASYQNVFPTEPNANGEWQHITINPKYAVPEANEGPVLEASVESEENPQQQESNVGGIVAGVLVVALLAGVLAGVAYHKRSDANYQDPAQFATDWWKDHTSEWWKGDSPIESDTNIAPANIPKHISSSWSYHTEESKDAKWEYSGDEEGSLHDVVI